MAQSDPAKVIETQAEQTAAPETPEQATREFRPDTLKPSAPASASAVQVPGYRILGVLGRGGMGVVYKAIQEKANRLVALKMILAGAHADQADHVRFRAEAEAAARLSHPNIVQLFEVSETPEGFPFFSLEFVPGGTLAERLKAGPLKALEAAAMLEALARAMQYAHENNIIHRDLKPANILLGARGQGLGGKEVQETMLKDAHHGTLVGSAPSSSSLTPNPQPLTPKISDFGLAKQLDAEDGLTRTGAIMGTPSYMAPEQAFGQSKNVGPAADIYALGAILYECLTGRPPFKGASVADTLEQVRTMEPVTVRAFIKEIPRDLETICLHCLHKDPQRRYLSAGALADDLRRYQEGKPILVRPVGELERTWRWCRRNKALAATLAAAAVLALAAIVILAGAVVTVSAENAKRKQAEDEAVAQSDLALGALGKMLTDVQTELRDVPGGDAVRKRILNQAIQQLEKMPQTAATSDRVMRRHMLAHQLMADIAEGLGDYKKAYDERVLAHDIAERALAANPNSDKNKVNRYVMTLQVADEERAHHALDAAQRARTLEKFEFARHGLEELQAKLRNMPDGDPALDKEEQTTLQDVEANLASLYDSLGNWQQSRERDPAKKNLTRALTLHLQALEIRERHVAADPSLANRTSLAESYELLATLAMQRDDLNAYLDHVEKLAKERRAILNKAPHSLSAKRKMANAAYRLGDACWLVGKGGDSLPFYLEALALHQQLAAIDPNDRHLQNSLCNDHYNAGAAARKQDNRPLALKHFQEVLKVRQAEYEAAEKRKNLDDGDVASYMIALARCGDHVRAAELADAMALQAQRQKPIHARQALVEYIGACYALCMDAVGADKTPDQLTAEEKKLRARYLDLSLAALKDGGAKGYNSYRYLEFDADLDPLRDVPAFQQWLAQLKRNAK